MSPFDVVALEESIYVQRAQDLIDQQCVLNSRHKDIQTVQTWIWTKICYVCVVSSVLCNGTSLNNIYHAAKERGRGVDSAHGGGGRGWGLVASIGLLKEMYMFSVLERA